MTHHETTFALLDDTAITTPDWGRARSTTTPFLQTESSSAAGRDSEESPQLLKLARDGDADAFCELCRAHESRLFRQAVALCGNLSLAEDLAQDTLVAAWKSIQRFQGQCRFFTWLCSILIHLHCNARRKRQPVSFSALARNESDEAEKLLVATPAPVATPSESLQQNERDATLRRCLERLTEKHREVVYLRFYVDTSLDGIAAALNCSTGTVKSRLFHALDKLSQMPELKRIANPAESL
jgi:RNA polymerase sigma-70 factor (ECF subfamily)